MHNPGPVPKVIVLGIDGMDPGFVERHWDVLPNLRRIRDQGCFARLATTTPPQSPVAWSTFITGRPPSFHGIYDFVHRDPRTLQPFSSFSRIEAPRFHLSFGPYTLPLSGSPVVSLRRGRPFWQLLTERKIPAMVIHMPTYYPPAAGGHSLAGMGVPDLGGTLGTFTFYTDDPEELSRAVSGGRIEHVELANGRVILPVAGPPNTLRKDEQVATAGLTVDVDPEHAVARLAIGGAAEILQEREWSGWLPAEFPLLRHVSSVRGMFRVYVKQLHPRLAIYVSPVNVDPVAPALPVSVPSEWSRDIARETGRYFTLGIAEDTAAFRHHILSIDEFQDQTRFVFDEEHRLLQYSLRHYREGLLFFYFSSIDQNSHMLWGRYESRLLGVYQAIDRAVGEARSAVPGAELIVLSDHGFTAFDRAVHLNSWLRHRGFLTAKEPAGAQTVVNVADWTATEAYAIGLNGLYLNTKGREREGIVEPGRPRDALIANLREQLTAWRDPANGKQVIEVLDENPASAQNAPVAPDLIVGYAPGYRASWQTGLGGIPDDELENNDDAWIGDHCINPADVPGVLFTTSGKRPQQLTLGHMTQFVLEQFGVRPE